MSARYLVTGAAGLIGFELTRQLLEIGDEVVAVDKYLKGGREDLAALAVAHVGRLNVIEADFTSGQSTVALDGHFDAIFHLAAIVGVRYVTDHPYATIAENLRSTLNILDYAVREGRGAFIFASSAESYASGIDGGYVPIPTPEGVPLSISDIALPRWSYAASKIAGEAAVFGAAKKAGFVPIILRFHNVYGPRMRPTHVIPELIERGLQRVNPFPLYGPDQTRPFLYVEDAARAVRLILNTARNDHGSIYNVGHPAETRIADLAQMVFEALNFHPDVEARPAPPGSVSRRVPDLARLRSLGFDPRVPLEEGIRRMVTAYRSRQG